MTITDISYSEEIYSISRLNREVRFLLEGNFASLWVEGEISNFVAHSSGHWYFSLKDTHAQVRCVMFKPHNRRLLFIPKDGMQVLAKVGVSLYEGRGEFQILVERLEEAGVGKLQKEFEALKKRLADAGLFEKAHKKTLPVMPRVIGVITSATGAAIRDILHVLKRRYVSAAVIIYPTLVQGELAANQIVNAIQMANQRAECDVLILARGGGSLEDLWSFNEENVAYAIYRCTIPVITGIGHEIDFTIADFVADLRAPTPSAAAELVTPNKEELLHSLVTLKKHLVHNLKQYVRQLQQKIAWIEKHLYQHHPKRLLAEQIKQLNFYQTTLINLQTHFIKKNQADLFTLHAKLQGLTPEHRIRHFRNTLEFQKIKLKNNITSSLKSKMTLLAELAAKLNTLSPLATLQRGYAIATVADNKKLLRSSQQVMVGQLIHLKLADGSVKCIVKE